MLTIIADSGATNTEWIIIEDKKVVTSVSTIGFNPYYYSPEELNKSIREKIIPEIKSKKVNTLFFYGSGISTENKKHKTQMALASNFPHIKIEVEHDLLAAARGMFQKEKGVACILGTGSNSCVYNGKDISHNIPSLGYFFADEGSGTHIGKLFIEDYLRDKIPEEIKKLAEKEHKLNNEQILDKIYNQPNPNRFLASFSYFVAQNIKLKYLQELVKKSFRLFFETYIIHYPGYDKLPIRVIGSIALIHEKLLKEVANEFGLKIDAIVKSPKEGLIKYHTQ